MILAVFSLCLLVQLGLTKDLVPLKDHELHQSEAVSPSNLNDSIAFSAELSEPAELLPGSVVRFDRIRANVGGWYFNNSGQFGCPNDDIYVFIWSTMKNESPAIDGIAMYS